jgi:putative transposase
MELKRYPEQPDNTYTIRQLSQLNCGDISAIRRRYAYIDKATLPKITVSNNETCCYSYHLLTEPDQARVNLYEVAVARKAQGDRIAELDELLAIPENPHDVQNLPAVIAVNHLASKELHVPSGDELNGKQHRIATFRTYFMRMIEQRPQGIGVTPFILELAEKIQSGEDEDLSRMAGKANYRKGNRTGISYDTLMCWWTKYQRAGGKGRENVLAPQLKKSRISHKPLCQWLKEYQPNSAGTVAIPDFIPAWLPYFLDAYRRPQKPSLHKALKKICLAMPPEIERPSYDQVRRIMKKMPDIYSEKGRKTGAEYNSLLGYVERDASEFPPMSICQIDGHSFKAYVAHPVTGKHFHPEVCGVICLSSKVLVGWHAGLAESHLTVAGAFKHACLVNSSKPFGGVPGILEADRGAGNMAKVNSDEFDGLFRRLGTEFIPPKRGGNPQGHGAIERSNQSIWIDAAKDLPTYTGKDMDRGARRKVYDQLERDFKAVEKVGNVGIVIKTSDLLMSWDEFLLFLDNAAATYNSTPHKALPKIIAPQPYNPTGPAVSRHMTPLECWQSYVEQGFEPREIGFEDERMLDHLCRPRVVVPVRRERFTLHGNSYHAAELAEFNIQEVIAVYDINDPRRVTVLNLNEEIICIAHWNGNRVHARPVSQVEKTGMERHKRRVSLKEKQLDLIHAEINDKTVEVLPTRIELSAEALAFMEREKEKEEQKKIDLEKPRLLTDQHEVRADIKRRVDAGETVSAYELQWAADYDKSREWDCRSRVGLYALDECCTGRFKPENQAPQKTKAVNG